MNLHIDQGSELWASILGIIVKPWNDHLSPPGLVFPSIPRDHICGHCAKLVSVKHHEILCWEMLMTAP